MNSDSFVSTIAVSNCIKMEQSEDDDKTNNPVELVTVPTRQWLSATVKESVPVPRETKIAKFVSDKTGKTSSDRMRKAISLDIPGKEKQVKFGASLNSSLRRSCVRKRVSKRLDQAETKYGHDKAGYEAIRERVLQERAVVNAIEALQERWRMLMYLHDDCIELTEGVKERRLRKLTIQRQFELIVVLSVFLLMCFPISLLLVFICRLS